MNTRRISDIKNWLIFFTIVTIFYPSFSFGQETNGSIEVNALYINGDRLAPQGVSVKVFQDYSEEPIKSLDDIPNGQFSIDGLPLNHDYRVEIYQYGVFLGEGTIFTKNPEEKILVVIQFPKGLVFNVFYNDGQTPIKDAKVSVTTSNGILVGNTLTDSDGKTSRFWLQPTRSDEYDTVKVSIGDVLNYTFSDLSVVNGAPGDIKVVTPWPPLVNNLITVQLYETPQEKSGTTQGIFVVELYDMDGNKMTESKVTDKGQAFFSNIKVGKYTLKVIQENMAPDTRWDPKIQVIDGSQQEIPIVKTIVSPPPEKLVIPTPPIIENKTNQTESVKTFPGCGCVAFRLDDVQDYYLNETQITIIKKFQENKADLTIGVIGSVIGSDENLIATINNIQSAPNNPLLIASQGWSGELLTSFSKTDQEKQITKSNEKIKSVFGVTPHVFIPPSNAFNADTFDILKSKGYTHFSAFGSADSPPYPLNGTKFYRFPSYTLTGNYDSDTGVWKLASNSEIKGSIEKSLNENGFSVVLLHPYEFSIYDGNSLTGEVDTKAVNTLGNLIDELRSEKLKIVKIDEINPPITGIIYEEPNIPETINPSPITNENKTETAENVPVVEQPKSSSPNGGGCLIATASFGSELSPQVQTLREIRDQMLMKTNSGRSFMVTFNEFYYSFSPTVADWERSNPVLKELVKIIITPLISTLSILTYLEIHSEAELVAYGFMIISLNLGIYFAGPTILIIKIREKFRKPKMENCNQSI